MVVLYHTRIGGLSAGYLGVDIFFVISGYLITTLVARAITNKQFSLADFYFRRAKRLLPAAYTTLLATTLLAPWFLNRQELQDLSRQVLGALTFTGNIVLWQQSGYFEGASDLKPLLHVWSLAVEEQYYFVLPALLLWIRPKRWMAGLALLMLGSLVLCLLGTHFKPVATFYLLPTRAWEMLIGSLGALWVLAPLSVAQRQPAARALRWLLAPALLCLFVLPMFPFGGSHPGLNAVVVCCATLVVILRDSHAVGNAAATKALAKLGDMSYSLYLVHWPIVAFINNAWVGSAPDVPAAAGWLALGLSMLLAWLLYRYVEEPLRHYPFVPSRKFVAGTVTASAALALISPLALQSTPPLDFETVRRPNIGLAASCEYDAAFEPRKQCRTGDAPTLLVWGDSYAMHLVPGLADSWEPQGIAQATKSQCGPLMGIAPRTLETQGHANTADHAWSIGCIRFNQDVLAYLRDTKSIHTVVLSSPLSQYLDARHHAHLIQNGEDYQTVPTQPAAAYAGLRRTIDAVQRLGKRVVLVAPPPSADFNVGNCLERELSGAFSFGGMPGCAVNISEYHTRRAPVLALLQRLRQEGIPVISFDGWLCNGASCRTMVDGTMLYRDSGHFSVDGSRLIAQRVQLTNQIRELAR